MITCLLFLTAFVLLFIIIFHSNSLDDFIIGVADASAYKQFGNSVAVPAIQATAEEIIKRINLQKSVRYGVKRK
jgi:site-specific DNA-cytosine methylase